MLRRFSAYTLILVLALSQFSFLWRRGETKTPAEIPYRPARDSSNMLCWNVIGLPNHKTRFNEDYIFDENLYDLRLDTLSQVKFWRAVMNLQEDTFLVNVASTRQVIEKMQCNIWNAKSDSLKSVYKDSVKSMLCLDTSQKILFTSGKKFFYDFDRARMNFHRGINCFIDNGVDPWYAQAILLIESPNKLQKSNAGAYGPFQLMKDVARLYGLKVNRHVDERADFDRSAFAASSLIKKICIPNTRRMLDSLNIRNYNEQDLWFRLLVMHVYHAGSYNVQKALFSCNPCSGNMDLIYTLWKTQTRRFKSASQNYSQLIIAAMFEMNDRHQALQLAKR
ncbi:MAG TPA: hypothetical protein PLQ93_04320 [Bacteroidia bacterium]|nr:hypothetical protein [Bacteroidia bacterium]